MILIAMDDPSHLSSEIIEKSLFAQTQTHCHNRVLTETKLRLKRGWSTQRQPESDCDSWGTVHHSPQTLSDGVFYKGEETRSQMTFTDTLIASGYDQGVDDRFDENCYIKWSFEEGVIHVYQEGEDEGEWFYVKMTEDCDVLTEVTFNPNVDTIIN